jgi:hypothetical protein
VAALTVGWEVDDRTDPLGAFLLEIVKVQLTEVAVQVEQIGLVVSGK